MILNSATMPESLLAHFKGGDGALTAQMFTDSTHKILLGRLGKNDTVGVHTHEDSTEIIYVLEGTARVMLDGQEEIVNAHCGHYCPKGHTHGMQSIGEKDLVFFAVVTQLEP